MKNKPIFGILLCLAAGALIASCGGKKAPAPSSSEESILSSEDSSVASSEDSSIDSSEESSEGTSEESEESSEDSSEEHIHEYAFENFIWDLTPGDYTAVAHLVCAEDGESVDMPALIEKTTIDPTCLEDGKNVYVATYEEHSETKEETLSAYGEHDFSLPPIWYWDTADYQYATARFECSRDSSHFEEITVNREDMILDVVTPATCSTSGSGTLTAKVTFLGNEYEDSQPVILDPTEEHEADEYGFCKSEGEYLGEEKSLTSSIAIGAMEEGAKAFYCIPAIEGHIYTLHDLIELEESEIAAFVMKDGAPSSVALDGTALTENDDDYLYLAITASNAKEDASFAVYGNHDFNELGVCFADDYFNGVELEIGKASNPISPFKNTDYFFRFPAEEGHVYTRQLSGFQTADLTTYYMNGDKVVADYDFTTPFPAGSYDGYCYIKANVGSYVVENATITVKVKTHPLDEHGFCQVEDGVYAGSEMPYDNPVSFELSPGKKMFFRYKPNQVEFPIDAYLTTDNYINHVVLEAKAFIKVAGVWTEIESADSNVSFTEFYFEKAGDDGYLYFELSNSLSETKTYQNFAFSY